MIRAFQWDLARQVERLDILLKLLPRYAEWGFQELYLHLEDAVHYPSLPGVGREDAYRYEDLARLVDAAKQVGIGVVPIANLLGHTQYLIKHPDWRDLNELRNEQGDPLASGQICPLHPRTADVAERLIRDLKPFCTAGKLHVGLDESFHLGKCPCCRAEVSTIGLAGHFSAHVGRLHSQVTAHGLQLGMWADMLYFVPEAIPSLPTGIIAYDWYYYPFRQKPKVEFFNFAERDLAPALRRRGIRYYGCPMNGAFRYEPLPVFGDRLANIRSWWERCRRIKAEGLLITSWEAYRLAFETTTIVDAAAAGLWLDSTLDDATTLLQRGLSRYFHLGGPQAGNLARRLLAGDEHAFSGYARWQINDRWDTFAGAESLQPYATERDFFERLLQQSENCPPSLDCSIRFRLYLARRDLFVRQSARAILRIRRRIKSGRTDAVQSELQALRVAILEQEQMLREGRRAARKMWDLTRRPKRRGQNEQILDRDKIRLRELRAWLTNVGRNPVSCFARTPLCGAAQLSFLVHNQRPAVQRVVVEECDEAGQWREIAARYTIEFRAQAARAESRLRREFSVPVSVPPRPLRLSIGGVGQVAISHAVITDGIEMRTLIGRRRHRLGHPAPRHGLPDPVHFNVGQILTLQQ